MLPISALALFLLTPADANLVNAERLLSGGRYTEALADLGRVTAASKQSGQWHLLSSKAYDGLNLPARAVEEAEAALAINPQDEAYHLQLGQIFLTRNTPQAAYSIFDEALKLFPDSLMLKLGRGMALMTLARHEEAEKDLTECLRRNPALGIAFESLETVYIKSARNEDAERLAAQFCQRDPSDYRAHYYLALSQDALGKDARPEAERALQLKPDYAPANVLLAKLLIRVGDSKSALAILERAVRERPDYRLAHLELATLYRKLDRKEDAARELAALNQLAVEKPALAYHRGAR